MVSTSTRSLLVLSLIVSHVASALWPFPKKRFTKNAFLEAGSLGLGDGRVAAFGDFNGDQSLDVVMLSSDSRQVTIYLWDHGRFSFRQSSTFNHPSQILNIVPGDFTHDGTLDLLVMSRSTQSTSAQDMKLYVGSRNGFDSAPLDVPQSTLAQPIPIDANGDLKIDLLGATPGSGQDALKLWKNVVDTSAVDPGPVFEVLDAPFVGQRCRIANPHSNAIADFDGDCLADVFLTCDDGFGTLSYQIWINDKSSGFTLARSGKLPEGTQSVSFADMDRDGTTDIVILSCASVDTRTGVGNDCNIDIVYNQQKPLCSKVGSAPFFGGDGSGSQKKRNCREVEELCTKDEKFKFDFETVNGESHQRIPISSLFPTSSPKPSILVRDTSISNSPSLPLALKLGDANLDGFPDILFVSALPSSHEYSPTLAISVNCNGAAGSSAIDDGASPAQESEAKTGSAGEGKKAKTKDTRPDAGCTADGKGRRGFRVLDKGVQAMKTIIDARGVAFIDVDEDGTLDIMVQRTGKQGQGTVSFVQNNVFYDAFFLKAIVLNGACDNGWCTLPNSSEKYHPFGVSYSGASYKYTVLDTTGRRSAAQVGQLPQTSYQALLTPYAFFGLGRTNNYIENLFVGSTRYANSNANPDTSPNSSQHFINMEGVIPNSKVVIYPPPSGADVSASGWRRELYLRPGQWIPLVTLTVVVVTAILAVIVGVLHWNEKREDELERRRASHHINFDAL